MDYDSEWDRIILRYSKVEANEHRRLRASFSLAVWERSSDFQERLNAIATQLGIWGGGHR
jgi:hypothetical protein